MKKILHLLFIPVALIVTESSAQLVNYFSEQWVEEYQHTNDDFYSNESRKTLVDPATGNIFVLADVSSNIDLAGTQTTNTYYYAVLIKYDANGTFLASESIDVGQHNINGFEFKSSFGLNIDDAGNIYAGYMSYNANSDFDVNISKFDNNLAGLWNYKYNNISNDQGIDMKTTASGEVFAIVKSVSNGTTIRYRLIKAVGQGLSTSSLYNFNLAPDFLNSLTVDANSNCYVTGYRLISGVKAFLTASVSSTGTLRWVKVDDCGSPYGNDAGNHISLGIDGFIYVTGSTTGTIQHGVDVVTFKLAAPNGKKAWENFINHTLNDGGVFINVEAPSIAYVSWVSDNSVFIEQIVTSSGLAGRRASYSPIPVSSYSGLYGASITDMKMSNNGNIYLTGNIAAMDGSQLFSAGYLVRFNFASRGASRIDCQAHILGSYSKSLVSTSIALNNQLQSVVWLLSESQNANNHQQEKIIIKSLNGVGTFRPSYNNTTSTITTFPSPATERVFISSENLISDISIYNVSGQLLLEKHFNQLENNQIELDILNFSPGIYLMQVGFADGTLDKSSLIIK